MARVFLSRELPFAAIDRLRAAHDVDVWEGSLPPTPQQLRDCAAGAHGLLTMLTDRVDADLLDAAPQLRAIANFAVGSDNIDLDETARRGIPVGVTPDVLTGATADLTFALILAAARRLPEAERNVRTGGWLTWEPAGFLGLELEGATIAIVGAGRIGQAVARRARGFGMRVIEVRSKDPLAPALREADVVSLHTPLTAKTRHLIDEQALRQMKPTAILVNTARGGVVDHDALGRALHAGTIAAAALDVTDPEPLPASDPLLSAPNLIVLPHIGSATHIARERMAELAVQNLLAGLAGEPLPHPAR
ncbi:MAG TPA: D-glycerate dehydrogenase [Solirubrobacteraceae bacterium]|nr:D-glycerate dehydrogenase [Solirubrobacteraceae bacterium]